MSLVIFPIRSCTPTTDIDTLVRKHTEILKSAARIGPVYKISFRRVKDAKEALQAQSDSLYVSRSNVMEKGSLNVSFAISATNATGNTICHVSFSEFDADTEFIRELFSMYGRITNVEAIGYAVSMTVARSDKVINYLDGLTLDRKRLFIVCCDKTSEEDSKSVQGSETEEKSEESEENVKKIDRRKFRQLKLEDDIDTFGHFGTVKALRIANYHISVTYVSLKAAKKAKGLDDHLMFGKTIVITNLL